EEPRLRWTAAALGGDVRQRHEGDDGGARRPALADDGADGGVIGRFGTAPLFTAIVAGQPGVDSGGVRVVDAVMNRADQAAAVQLFRQPRQVFGKLDAGDAGGNGLE